ncbi:hypothetical protein AAMO2058_000723800 [Amorphochlora amoebiformis]
MILPVVRISNLGFADATGRQVRGALDALGILKGLKKAGVALGIASAGSRRGHSLALLRALGLDGFFKPHCICVFPGAKDEHIKRVCKAARVEPDKAILVDDMPYNRHACKRTGAMFQFLKRKLVSFTDMEKALATYSAQATQRNSFKNWFKSVPINYNPNPPDSKDSSTSQLSNPTTINSIRNPSVSTSSSQASSLESLIPVTPNTPAVSSASNASLTQPLLKSTSTSVERQELDTGSSTSSRAGRKRTIKDFFRPQTEKAKKLRTRRVDNDP